MATDLVFDKDGRPHWRLSMIVAAMMVNTMMVNTMIMDTTRFDGRPISVVWTMHS